MWNLSLKMRLQHEGIAHMGNSGIQTGSTNCLKMDVPDDYRCSSTFDSQ